MDAIEALGAHLAEARLRSTDPPTEVVVPIGILDTIAHLADPPDDGDSAGDLIVLLDAVDIVDCSPRMVQRRVVLKSQLRLVADDEAAQAGARDLLEAARLRRRVRLALTDALDRGRLPLAQALKLVLVAAETEIPGWQLSAMAALEGDLNLVPIRPRKEGALNAAQRLLVALQDRGRGVLPAEVSFTELHRDFRGPEPRMAQAVATHPVLAAAVKAALDQDGLGCVFQADRGTALLTVTRRVWDEEASRDA